jgi:G3E family GTPase
LQLLLFSGFLGSGKTTLILSLARRFSEQGLRSCLVVNEVGEVGIDGRVLEDGGQEVYEITSGCICCQIGVDLVRTLEEVASRYSPDLFIVEASGVATPAGVRDALQYYRATPLTTRVVTLLDPTRLEALVDVMEPLIESQIREADRLVITKLDEASSEEAKFARETAARLAPEVPLCELSAEDPALVEACLRQIADDLPGSSS